MGGTGGSVYVCTVSSGVLKRETAYLVKLTTRTLSAYAAVPVGRPDDTTAESGTDTCGELHKLSLTSVVKAYAMTVRDTPISIR